MTRRSRSGRLCGLWEDADAGLLTGTMGRAQWRVRPAPGQAENQPSHLLELGPRMTARGAARGEAAADDRLYVLVAGLREKVGAYGPELSGRLDKLTWVRVRPNRYRSHEKQPAYFLSFEGDDW